MMLMLCATTSCISRAIRLRSSATAWRASDSRCSATRAAPSCSSAASRVRVRTLRPTSQQSSTTIEGKNTFSTPVLSITPTSATAASSTASVVRASRGSA